MACMLIEQKLIKRIKKKQNKEAANALISYYYKEVYAYVYRQTGNELRKNKKEHLFDSAIYGIINHDINHVHVMFCAQPRTELSKFINAYKSASSRLLKKEYPEIRKKLWKEAFWSQSFCLLTDGGTPVEVIRQYIET